MFIVNGNAAQTVLLDSGYFFGRGVFETFLVKSQPLFLNEHFKRLRHGLAALGIENAPEQGYLTALIERYGIRDCVLKLAVTEKNMVVATRSIPYRDEDYARGFRLGLSGLKRNPDSHVTYLKSLNYTDNMLEREKAAESGFQEVLFLNTREEIAEGSASNIFFVRNGQLFTPEVACGLLDGIIRTWVKRTFEVAEGRFKIQELENADEIFVTNSVLGIMPVTGFRDRGYPAGPVCRRIRARYEDAENMVIKNGDCNG